MPNHITNKLVVNADQEIIEFIFCTFDEFNSGNYKFSFNKSIQEPDYKNNIDYDWLNWRYDNWGTKWDAYDITIIGYDRTQIELIFQTAWTPPQKWLEKISLKYPKLKCKLSWVDEDYPNSGFIEIKNGLINCINYGYDIKAEEFVKREFPDLNIFTNKSIFMV